ncbi:uncharacterized protein LY89DRAFT_771518 [Mollisia scopiformis]|uniref:DUF7905 domain-containing protein n=1 Tax=Mollisia scopiformis TaxID=149040 RepID=A0A194XK51_MOLSC|nr:uncharacterized protein LY89DRAFT_771518 [Mollisia scopiformis]KUJ20585.1 hypothetical protein LY89DRAFT_771518 [Mollisia scopiformis]
MDPFKKLERDNAKEWDDVSEVGTLPPTAGLPIPSAAHGINYAGLQPLSRNTPAVVSAPKLIGEQETSGSGAPSAIATYGKSPSQTLTLLENGKYQYCARQPQIPSTAGTQGPTSAAQQGRPAAGNSQNIRAMQDAQYGVRQPQAFVPPRLQSRVGPPLGGRAGNAYQPLRAPNHQSRGTPRHTGRRSPTKFQSWAEPPPLLTNRMADFYQEKTVKQQEDEQYMRRPDKDEEFPAIAYYIWPSNDEAERPREILGQGLEELNAVRRDYKVFVHLNKDDTCIKICSRVPEEEDPDNRLQVAIRAIREIIAHRRAIQLMAQPTHIVIPPTAEAMTTIVKPAIVLSTGRRHHVTALELAGEKLSEEEKLKWMSERPERLQACRKTFEDAMTKGLRGLAPYKGWMQMRLRFGHVTLHNARPNFKNGKSPWEEFFNMMNNVLLTSTLKPNFDDAIIVQLLCQKILSWPEKFVPADGRYKLMQDVPFKDTEVIFFRTTDGPFRLEVEIDTLAETGEYQVGSIRLFRDNNRNKRIRVTNVDVEKQIDWSIEIITDNEIPITEIPAKLLDMAKGSVTPKTPALWDHTDLPYPAVNPRKIAGLIIDEIVVKTVAEYMVKDSGYVVELSVYRKLVENNDPEITAGVAMYNRNWDYNMRSLKDTTQIRRWENPLKLFFGRYSSEGIEAVEGNVGVESVLADVENIRDFLVDAVNEIEATKKQQEQMLAEEDAAQGPWVEVDENAPGQTEIGPDEENFESIDTMSSLVQFSDAGQDPTQNASAGEDLYEDLYSAE